MKFPKIKTMADLMDFETHVQKQAIALCPEYPNIEKVEAWEAFYAITSSLEGVTKACEDWSEFCKHMGVDVTSEEAKNWFRNRLTQNGSKL